MAFKKGVTPPGAIPFVKGKSGNPKGRPKLLTEVNADLRSQGFEPVTPAELKEVYFIILNLHEEKIKEIIAGQNYPMFLRVIAKAILGGKGFEIIEKMLDRAVGKATQSLEVTGKDGQPLAQETTHTVVFKNYSLPAPDQQVINGSNHIEIIKQLPNNEE